MAKPNLTGYDVYFPSSPGKVKKAFSCQSTDDHIRIYDVPGMVVVYKYDKMVTSLPDDIELE